MPETPSKQKGRGKHLVRVRVRVLVVVVDVGAIAITVLVLVVVEGNVLNLGGPAVFVVAIDVTQVDHLVVGVPKDGGKLVDDRVDVDVASGAVGWFV